MKPVEHRLILMRHAEALPAPEGDTSHSADFSRALSPAGMQMARLRGAQLRGSRMSPDLVLCSPAMRTRQTYMALLPFAGDNPEIRIEPALYNADVTEILVRLRASLPSAHTVLLVAHNPGITQLAQFLTGENSALESNFTPATLAVFRVETDVSGSVTRGWKNLGARTAWLEFLLQN